MKHFNRNAGIILFALIIGLSSCKKETCDQPTADFTCTTTTPVAGDTISLTNNSVNGLRSRWEIVDVSYPGSYFLETGNSVCLETAPRVVIRGSLTIRLTVANECYETDVREFSILNVAVGTGSWTTIGFSGATARMHAVGFSIGSKGYIGTGLDGTQRRDFWEWDQTTGVWTQMADFGGTARESAVGFSIGAKGYIGTGWDGTAQTNDFWEWDQATNAWMQISNLPGMPRQLAVAFSIGNKGYVGTGYNSGSLQDFWEWDPTSGVWTQKADFAAAPRSGAVGFSIGNNGYIGAGSDGYYGAFFSDFWEYDVTSDSWIQKASVPGTVRRNAIGFALGNKGFIGTGNYVGPYTSPGYLKDLWRWDQATDTWRRKTDYAGGGREGVACFVIDSIAYIGMGYYVNYHNDFWAFDPEE